MDRDRNTMLMVIDCQQGKEVIEVHNKISEERCHNRHRIKIMTKQISTKIKIKTSIEEKKRTRLF